MRTIRGLTLAGLAVSLAACQPQARRLLVLDEAATQPAELDVTARPWRDAGYRVEYRRYYPHLTRADLDRYRVVMVLGGRGATAADALHVGDLAILTEWTLRGGVVVLGYPPDGATAEAFDRWLMNRWLSWSGAGITIGNVALRGPAPDRVAPAARAVLTTGLRGTGLAPFPSGVNNALLVDDDAQVLARAVNASAAPGSPPGDVSIVAASRAANGLILVASRSALAAGPGARAFLVALARLVRRPAEWSRIPASGARVPLQLTGGPRPVAARSPRPSPPPGVAIVGLAPRVRASALPASAGIAPAEAPSWVPREGLRGLEGDFPALDASRGATTRAAAIDSLTRLLDVGAFNMLVTNAHVAPLVDSVPGERWKRDALRAAWQQVAGRLQSTSVRWIPLVAPRDLASRGDSGAVASCPLDPALWGRLVSAIRALAQLAASHRDLIPAVGLSLDESARSWTSPPFCDAAWEAGLDALVRDSTLPADRSARLRSLPLTARYDSLVDGGLLAVYDSAVAGVVVQRAATLRAALRRARRDLLFAVVLDQSPANWFTLGLVEGMSERGAPALVFSPDPRARRLLAMGGAENAVHLLRLEPETVLKGEGPGVPRATLQEQDGFWLAPAESLLSGASDSLARLVRRIVKER